MVWTTGGQTLNFYKRYPGDYMRDTGALTLAEHGAYNMMLDIYYSTEKPLPKGKALYRLLRCETALERKAVDSVVRQFWIEGHEGLVNERAEKELERAEAIRARNKENGHKGGRPKKTQRKPKNNPKETQSVKFGFDLENQHQTPDTRHQTPDLTPPVPDARVDYLEIDPDTGEVIQ